MDVRTIADALPTARRRYRRVTKPPSKPMPSTLPQCFAEVWRRRHSVQPFDRRQRATLEAVASAIPEHAAGSTAEPAAAVYLAALVVSLQRLVTTTKVSKPLAGADIEKPLSKKARKQLRKQQRDAEDSVKEMAAADALGGKDAEVDGNSSMAVDGGAVDEADENVDENVELIASLLSLIGMAVSGTSQAVLNTKCDVVLEAVMNAHDHVLGNRTVARIASPVFASVLSMLDSVSWSKPVVQRAYLYLLRQTSDTDSRSRRRARDALVALLMSPRAAIVRAKTSNAGSSHFASELKLQLMAYEEGISGDNVLEKASSPAPFIYLLTSVERFGLFLMPQDAARVSKELILIASKCLPSVTPFAYMALNALFSHKEEASEANDEKNTERALLSQADLAKLLGALLDNEPPKDCAQDIQLAYNGCITDGAIAYASYYTFSPPPLQYVVPPVRILCDSVSPTSGRTDLTKNACVNLRSVLSQRWFKSRPEILSKLQEFLGHGYRLHWQDTIPVLKTYIEQDMAAGAAQMNSQIQRLLKITISTREKARMNKEQVVIDLTTGVLAAIIRGGGAEHVLGISEIHYDKKVHLTNAWMIPILRENLRGAPLALFASHFLPLIEKLKEAISTISKQDRTVETKNLGIYASQLWALLPGFCNRPCDLGQAGVWAMVFRNIHTCLSMENQYATYATGIAALRQLSMSLTFLDSQDPMTRTKRESFGSRLKKLFPTLMSVAESIPDEKRRALLESLTKACQATDDPSLVSGFLRKSIRRLLELQLHRSKDRGSDDMVDEDDNIIQKHHAMADIAIAIIESGRVPSDAAEIAYLEKAMSPFLLDTRQSSLQKKSYRAIALLVGMGATTTETEELCSLAKRIAEANSTVSPGGKAARQGLIVTLINQNVLLGAAVEKMQYLKLLSQLFLSEIVLATRDTSDKTRSSAFETLVTLARGWNGASVGNDVNGLRDFFLAVAAGLGGKTVPMLSATLTSLGRLIYEFSGEASTETELANTVDSLFASRVVEDNSNVTMGVETTHEDERVKDELIQPGPIAILLRHTAFEVQKAALGVIKIATKALSTPPTRLTSVLPGILPGLVYVAARSKKQETRLRVRVILERLLRKCGRDVLEENFPQDHLKLLTAVRKKYSRDLIKKHAAKDKRREAAEDAKYQPLEDGEGNDEDAEDFGLDDSDSDVEREIVDGDELIYSKKASQSGDDNSLLVKEGNDNVMDLLDTKNSRSVLTGGDAEGTVQRARLEQRRKRSREADSVIKYTDDGRPIFVESDNDSGEAELGSGDDDGSDSDSDIRKKKTVSIKKRKHQDYQNGERHSKKQKGTFGEEYRAKKAFGDVKRAGRPDPYAYIPLGGNMIGSNPRSGSLGSKQGRQASSLRHLVTKRAKKSSKFARIPGKR